MSKNEIKPGTPATKLAGIRRVLDSRTLVTQGPDAGKHSGAGADTVVKVLDVLQEVITELTDQGPTAKIEYAKSELQGLLDSLDSHITQDEIYSAIKTIQEAL
ncbi:hypothetical protein SEA_JEMERALD_58 [Microbacterium phage Jemerald]|nr:hypothetical protein SEA_JUICER_58 [Microbacterium phage Juicer]WNO27297.1 hypothetical protein SEA_JEMERALD_58 [Microbacterium phage Jemerald]